MAADAVDGLVGESGQYLDVLETRRDGTGAVEPRPFVPIDVFGSSTPSIISGGTMDIAKAIRGESGMVGGYCDFYGGTGFTCCNNNGAGMDWRRYNSYKSDNLWCSGLHPYANNSCGTGNNQHGPLGDSYSCDKGGQRSVAGHMWWEYNVGGTPCTNYSGYGCYGSRWIR